jgi:phospholipid/cholesterol/gamma-HCH transport system ATP-binding protein
MPTDAHVTVRNLTMAYGSFVLMRDLDFEIRRGDVFVIMGGSGCGKSTLMRHLIGLKEPATGEIFYGDQSFTKADPETRVAMQRRFGVLYQSGALMSSMTLAENVSLPLGEFTDLGSREIAEVAALKLALVGLAGFGDFYPSEISGGMQKRAGLARAIALDPEILFFDEPSAGLDPISSHLLDDLILELRDSLGATVVMVTHELASIFAIGTNSIFLDPETRSMLPLRERVDDIPLLVAHFTEKYGRELGKEVDGFSEEATACLLAYPFPGNVRELENVVERATALSRDRTIGIEALPPSLLAPTARGPVSQIPRDGIDLESTVNEFERTLLAEALRMSGGVKKKAAQLLRVSFRSFRYRLEKLGLDGADEEDA